MTKVRVPKKYDIGKYKFMEAYYYCLQYNEWKDELEYNTDTVKSQVMTGMPVAAGEGDATERLAMRRADLANKMKMIEDTAIEADNEIHQYILKAVTNEDITYKYLQKVMNIPCGKDKYYKARRKFYYLMSKKI